LHEQFEDVYAIYDRTRGPQVTAMGNDAHRDASSMLFKGSADEIEIRKSSAVQDHLTCTSRNRGLQSGFVSDAAGEDYVCSSARGM
jgi:hypothetical protein